jgi:hypothetical protein
VREAGLSAFMEVRKWLTGSQGEAAAGCLSLICVRIFTAWGLLSAPLFTAAALIWVFLPAGFVWISVGLLVMIGLTYLYLLVQGIRLFRPAEPKDMGSGLFTVLQVTMVVTVGWACLNARIHLNDMLIMLGLFFSAVTAFLDLTFIVIGLAARQRVGMAVWAGFVAALVSICLFVRTELLG